MARRFGPTRSGRRRASTWINLSEQRTRFNGWKNDDVLAPGRIRPASSREICNDPPAAFERASRRGRLISKKIGEHGRKKFSGELARGAKDRGVSPHSSTRRSRVD